MSAELIEALDNMLKERPVVRLSERLQAAIDPYTQDAITAVAVFLAEEGNPQELRSQAVRYMLRRAAEVIRSDARKQMVAAGRASA